MSDLTIVILLVLWVMSGYIGVHLLRRKGRYDAHLQGQDIDTRTFQLSEHHAANIGPSTDYLLLPLVAGAFLLVAALILSRKPVAAN
jgi:hypothetical protein